MLLHVGSCSLLGASLGVHACGGQAQNTTLISDAAEVLRLLPGHDALPIGHASIWTSQAHLRCDRSGKRSVVCGLASG